MHESMCVITFLVYCVKKKSNGNMSLWEEKWWHRQNLERKKTRKNKKKMTSLNIEIHVQSLVQNVGAIH